MAEPECVRVVVRVRPTNERERRLQGTESNVVSIRPPPAAAAAASGDLPTRLQITSKAHEVDASYNYDAIFGSDASQHDVYRYVQSSVEQVVQGFNCTIFAYGQTGTGKTHTMMGPDSSLRHGDMSQWGIIPRAVDGLFQELKAVGSCGAGAFVHCSYMQIYNNQVYDLLQASMKDQPPLQVREMIKGHAKHIYVSGISEFRVGSAQEVLDLLHLGSKNRTIRATECNEKSSRSHALLQLSMEVESLGTERTTIIRRAKLNLVDLAGSEKWDTDVAMTTDRTRELRNINASLSALGNVIAALTDKKRTHIPYRDSKLTRLLQDSLGGNTRTIVIATISPSDAAVEETISTLQFAERAKQISLNVQVNEVVDDAVLLARAQREIQKLKLQLSVEQPNVAAMTQRIQALERQVEALTAENRQLKAQLAATPPEVPRTAPAASTLTDDSRVETPPTSRSKRLTPALQSNTNQDAGDNAIDWEQHTRPYLQQLEGIQKERRDLEAQLEQLKFAHVPEDDDVCPMCHHVIDHHTDAELDRCIELEAQVNGKRQESLLPAAPKAFASTAALPSIKPTITKSILEPQAFSVDPIGGSGGAAVAARGNLSSRGSSKSNPPPSLAPMAPPKPKPKRSQTVKLLKSKNKLHKSPYVAKKQEDKQANDAALGTGLHYDVRDIGLTLTVYTYRYDCWYPCTIVGYDSKRKMHCCLYDFGDKQWTALRDKKFQVMGRPQDTSPRERSQPPPPPSPKRKTSVSPRASNNQRSS
ncbi:unnamed protein product [Aphanomyces euteiches]